MLSQDEVKHIAHLARIHLSDQEVERYGRDLSQVLDFFRDLEKVDTAGVGMAGMIIGKENETREDRVKECDAEIRKGIIANMPKTKDGYLEVKAVF